LTNEVFEELYIAARAEWPRVQLSALKRIRDVYIQAADEAAAVVRATEAAQLSDLTSSGWRAVERQLRDSARIISEFIEKAVPGVVSDCYWLTENTPGPGRIDQKYLTEALIAAGDISAVVPSGISNIYQSINKRLVAALVSQQWPDGYTFSERIWGGINQQYQADIKRVVQAGVAQGRDVTQIARDIEVYARNGRDYTFSAGRYGKLLPGTREYSRRVGRAIDYRALRLVRSELYSAMQTAAAWQGQSNPACRDSYDWELNAGRQSWPCECEDLAQNSPYRFSELPGYPHSNCFQKGTRILTLHGEKNIEDILPGEYIITHNGNAKRVLKAWKTLYSGEMITVDTGERTIKATSNHPFLSGSSFIPAHTLKNGDDLVSVSVDIKPLPFCESKSEDCPSFGFQENSFFRVVLYFNGASVPIPAINFNGELYVLKGEINVESEYSEVRDRFLSALYEGFIHHPFVWGPDLSGPELSAFGFLFVRVDAASDSLMRSIGVCNESVFISAVESLCNSKRFKSMPEKIPVDTRPGDFQSIRYLLNREILIAKEFDDDLPININFNTHNISIVSVSSEKVKGYVYNLTVEDDHSYIAEGVAVHNCQCVIRQRLMDHDEFMSDLTAWSDGERVDYLDDWYNQYYIPAQSG
jgi:hypothetical protein